MIEYLKPWNVAQRMCQDPLKGGVNMASNAQAKAVRKYDDAHTVQINLKLNKKTDADILAALNQSGNKQGLIKAALRDYINIH